MLLRDNKLNGWFSALNPLNVIKHPAEAIKVVNDISLQANQLPITGVFRTVEQFGGTPGKVAGETMKVVRWFDTNTVIKANDPRNQYATLTDQFRGGNVIKNFMKDAKTPVANANRVLDLGMTQEQVKKNDAIGYNVVSPIVAGVVDILWTGGLTSAAEQGFKAYERWRDTQALKRQNAIIAARDVAEYNRQIAELDKFKKDTDAINQQIIAARNGANVNVDSIGEMIKNIKAKYGDTYFYLGLGAIALLLFRR